MISNVGELKKLIEDVPDDTFLSVQLKDNKRLTYVAEGGTFKIEHDEDGNYLHILAKLYDIL